MLESSSFAFIWQQCVELVAALEVIVQSRILAYEVYKAKLNTTMAACSDTQIEMNEDVRCVVFSKFT